MDEKIKMLLDAQEHPEQFTDEDLRQMAEDAEISALMEATAQGKRALMKQQYEAATEDVDAAWQEFETKHFHKTTFSSLYKMAASFIGLLFISGIAFAAVHFVRHIGESTPAEEKTQPVEVRVAEVHEQPTDTVTTVQPVVFDNVPLDSILPQIASHYGYAVTFRSEQPKSLRLFLTWNPQDSIQKVTDELNLFEQIHIMLDSQTMIVE